MITFIKNNAKLSLSLFVIFIVYSISFFIQQSEINALKRDVFLAEQEIIEKSKPSEVELIKNQINLLYGLREEEKQYIDDMKNQIIDTEEYVFQLESQIRCEKENLLWTGWINCKEEWINFPLVK